MPPLGWNAQHNKRAVSSYGASNPALGQGPKAVNYVSDDPGFPCSPDDDGNTGAEQLRPEEQTNPPPPGEVAP